MAPKKAPPKVVAVKKAATPRPATPPPTPLPNVALGSKRTRQGTDVPPIDSTTTHTSDGDSKKEEKPQTVVGGPDDAVMAALPSGGRCAFPFVHVGTVSLSSSPTAIGFEERPGPSQVRLDATGGALLDILRFEHLVLVYGVEAAAAGMTSSSSSPPPPSTTQNGDLPSSSPLLERSEICPRSTDGSQLLAAVAYPSASEAQQNNKENVALTSANPEIVRGSITFDAAESALTVNLTSTVGSTTHGTSAPLFQRTTVAVPWSSVRAVAGSEREHTSSSSPTPLRCFDAVDVWISAWEPTSTFVSVAPGRP